MHQDMWVDVNVDRLREGGTADAIHIMFTHGFRKFQEHMRNTHKGLLDESEQMKQNPFHKQAADLKCNNLWLKCQQVLFYKSTTFMCSVFVTGV